MTKKTCPYTKICYDDSPGQMFFPRLMPKDGGIKEPAQQATIVVFCCSLLPYFLVIPIHCFVVSGQSLKLLSWFTATKRQVGGSYLICWNRN